MIVRKAFSPAYDGQWKSINMGGCSKEFAILCGKPLAKKINLCLAPTQPRESRAQSPILPINCLLDGVIGACYKPKDLFDVFHVMFPWMEDLYCNPNKRYYIDMETPHNSLTIKYGCGDPCACITQSNIFKNIDFRIGYQGKSISSHSKKNV